MLMMIPCGTECKSQEVQSCCLHLLRQYSSWASQYEAKQAACQQVSVAGRLAWRLSAAQGRTTAQIEKGDEAQTARLQPCLCQMQSQDESAHTAVRIPHLHLSSCGSRAVMHMVIKGLKLF